MLKLQSRFFLNVVVFFILLGITTMVQADDVVAVPEASAQALSYYKSGNLLWIAGQVVDLLIPLIILFFGFSAKIRTMCQNICKNNFLTILSYLLVYGIIFQIVHLPLDFYAGYLRPHEYGLSSQSIGRYFNHWSKSALIWIATLLLIVWIPYFLMKKSPKRWWMYGGLISIPVFVFFILIQPLWVEPLFNHFTPIHDKQLEEKILALAHRAGIEHGQVFQVDKSADTTMINAYVTGIGTTQRIVLWDTILKQMNTEEILFVMGHEMGHYVLNHMWWYLGQMIIMSFVVFYVIYRLSSYLIQRFKKRFQFKTVSDIASFPLLMILLLLISLITDPIFNLTSQHLEHEADRFGLEITQNNHAAAMAFVKLQNQNLGNPRPGIFYQLWRNSHPSLYERIIFCNSYHPWKEGLPLKYENDFSSTPKK